jgi:hypothetical protein
MNEEAEFWERMRAETEKTEVLLAENTALQIRHAVLKERHAWVRLLESLELEWVGMPEEAELDMMLEGLNIVAPEED